MATAFRFIHGAYATAAGAARPVSMSITPREINTFQTSYIYDLQVELWMAATAPGDFVSQIDGLIAALKVPRVNSGIQYTTDDGSTWFNSSHFLNYAGSMMGPFAKPISVPSGPLQYATEQYVQVSIQAEYTNTSENVEILRYDETLEIIGEGGPKTILRPRHTSQSLVQQLRPYTDVRVMQSGLIVGRTAYPSLPSPLIATSGARQVDMTRDRKTKKQNGSVTIEWHRSYSYEFLLNSHPGTVNPGSL